MQPSRGERFADIEGAKAGTHPYDWIAMFNGYEDLKLGDVFS